VYVKPCFATLNGSNTKCSRVKPCVQCIMWLVTNLIKNWVLVIIWVGLLPICISMFFHWIGVQFLFNIKNLLYKFTFVFLCYFQFEDFEILPI